MQFIGTSKLGKWMLVIMFSLSDRLVSFDLRDSFLLIRNICKFHLLKDPQQLRANK